MTPADPVNPLRRIWRAGGTATGVGLTISAPALAQLIALTGFDWLMIDLEHGAISPESAQRWRAGCAASGIERRLTELGITLPEPMAPAGRYVPAVRLGDLVFLFGTGPVRPDGSLVTGKADHDLDLDAAREAARLTGLQILSVLQAELGSLYRVRRVAKLPVCVSR